MVRLSPTLSRRLVVKKHARRIVDESTASFYEVIPADAPGALGSNPHGVLYDELLTAPSGDLWNALRTGAGARTQSLLLATTTAGADRDSFCYAEYSRALRALQTRVEDPLADRSCRSADPCRSLGGQHSRRARDGTAGTRHPAHPVSARSAPAASDRAARDEGYDFPDLRAWLRSRDIVPRIARRGKADHFLAFAGIAAALISHRHLNQMRRRLIWTVSYVVRRSLGLLWDGERGVGSCRTDCGRSPSH